MRMPASAQIQRFWMNIIAIVARATMTQMNVKPLDIRGALRFKGQRHNFQRRGSLFGEERRLRIAGAWIGDFRFEPVDDGAMKEKHRPIEE